MTTWTPPRHRLLIASVGGNPQPVVSSLLHWRPARVIFLPSERSTDMVDTILRSFAEHVGGPLSVGSYEIYRLSDAEDFSECVGDMRRALGPEVERWRSRGEDHEVVVDFTAGTKCMSAALALIARLWPCTYSYVGGERRDKQGLGVVVTGTERVVHAANPWDALGYQAVEQAVRLFNGGQYAAASELLTQAIERVGDPGVKRELATLRALCQAYLAWDRFDHKTACQRFADALKNRNDLFAMLQQGDQLVDCLEEHHRYVTALSEEREPTTAWVTDLLANAKRRAREQRFDDAVARLYRAVEALAQVRLRERYGVRETKEVDLAQVPQSLRAEWRSRAKDGTITLGLQDAYRLLKMLSDDLGVRFSNLRLDDPVKSPLAARNASVLAHGFQPASQQTFDALWAATQTLTQITEDALPLFPELRV